MESEDSFLICDSDIIDVISVETDLFNRSVSCSMQQTTEYNELVKLMTMRDTAKGHLDERYLWRHKYAAPVSLPFLTDMHTELSVERSIRLHVIRM